MASYNDIRKKQAMDQVKAETLQAQQAQAQAMQEAQAQQQAQMQQAAEQNQQQQFNNALAKVYAPNQALEMLNRNAITEQALREEAMQRRAMEERAMQERAAGVDPRVLQAQAQAQEAMQDPALAKYMMARSGSQGKANDIADQIIAESMGGSNQNQSNAMSALEAFAAAKNRA
jgi:hypothetical protein